jgi:hypothetical protein
LLAAEGAALAVVAVVGGDVDAGEDKALGLAQFGAGAVEVDLLDVGEPSDFPVHQALVLGHGGGFAPSNGSSRSGTGRLVEIGRQ